MSRPSPDALSLILAESGSTSSGPTFISPSTEEGKAMLETKAVGIAPLQPASVAALSVSSSSEMSIESKCGCARVVYDAKSFQVQNVDTDCKRMNPLWVKWDTDEEVGDVEGESYMISKQEGKEISTVLQYSALYNHFVAGSDDNALLLFPDSKDATQRTLIRVSCLGANNNTSLLHSIVKAIDTEYQNNPSIHYRQGLIAKYQRELKNIPVEEKKAEEKAEAKMDIDTFMENRHEDIIGYNTKEYRKENVCVTLSYDDYRGIGLTLGEINDMLNVIEQLYAHISEQKMVESLSPADIHKYALDDICYWLTDETQCVAIRSSRPGGKTKYEFASTEDVLKKVLNRKESKFSQLLVSSLIITNDPAQRTAAIGDIITASKVDLPEFFQLGPIDKELKNSDGKYPDSYPETSRTYYVESLVNLDTEGILANPENFDIARITYGTDERGDRIYDNYFAQEHYRVAKELYNEEVNRPPEQKNVPDLRRIDEVKNYVLYAQILSRTLNINIVIVDMRNIVHQIITPVEDEKKPSIIILEYNNAESKRGDRSPIAFEILAYYNTVNVRVGDRVGKQYDVVTMFTGEMVRTALNYILR